MRVLSVISNKILRLHFDFLASHQQHPIRRHRPTLILNWKKVVIHLVPRYRRMRLAKFRYVPVTISWCYGLDISFRIEMVHFQNGIYQYEANNWLAHGWREQQARLFGKRFRRCAAEESTHILQLPFRCCLVCVLEFCRIRFKWSDSVR